MDKFCSKLSLLAVLTLLGASLLQAQSVVILGATSTCQGNTVNLVASASGGSGFTYLWSTGATGNNVVVQPTATTTYSVTATNSVGGTATASRTITVNPRPTPSVSGVNDICQGTSTSLTATGGAAYTWNTGQATAQVNVFPPVTTTYTVTATSSLGCTATTTYTVTVRSLPQIQNVQALSPNSCQINNGSIAVFATATFPIEYSLNSGAWQTSNLFSNLGPGSYTVRVRYQGGLCLVTYPSTLVLTAPSAPNVNLLGASTICAGTSVNLVATGAADYTWSNGATGNVVNVSNGGIYSVTGTATNGCTSIATKTLTELTSPTVGITGTDTICIGGGAGTLVATGADTYFWNTGISGPIISITSSGYYQVTGTNSNGCSNIAGFTVVSQLPPNATLNGPAVVCQGTSTTLTAGGGVSYLWNNGQTTQTITVTPSSSPSVFTVTVTDATGCTGSQSVPVLPAPSPIIVFSNSTICETESTTLTASGGGTYQWVTGETTPTIVVSPTATTNYFVTVTTPSGCVGVTNVTVNVRPLPVISNVIHSNPTTCNVNNGSITVFASGSWSTIEYRINGGPWQTSNSFPNLGAGTYAIEVRYVGGLCPVSYGTQVVLTAPLSPNTNISGVTEVCSGQSTTLNASSGVAYLWNTGSTTGSTTFFPASTGVYNVTVTAANGCTGVGSVVVTVKPSPIAQIVAPGGACALEQTLIQAVDAGPGTTYAWNFGPLATPQFPTVRNPSISYADSGSMVITLAVTGTNGCISYDTTGLNVNVEVTAFAGFDQLVCAGGTVILGGTGSNPTGPPGATYLWTPSVGLNDPTVSNPLATPSDSTQYTVNVSFGSCTTVLSLSVNVDVNSVPFADAGPNQSICDGESVQIGGLPTGDAGSYYFWSPSIGLDNPNIANPIASPGSTTLYTVTVTKNGCSRTDQVLVEVRNRPFVDAGVDQVGCGVEPGVLLGGQPAGSPSATFVWSPVTGLTNPFNPNPFAVPTQTTIYVLQVTQAGCTTYDTVIVAVDPRQNSCNQPPITVDDINNTLMGIPVWGDISTNDYDPEGGILFNSWLTTTGPSNGVIFSFNQLTGEYLYIPYPGFTGQDQFTYVGCDGGAPNLCDTAVVTIIVRGDDPGNTPPIANNDVTMTMTGNPVTGNMITNDGDPDGDPIAVTTTPLSNPSNGTVVIFPNGTFTYTPDPNFIGEDVFTYQLCDNRGLCDTATVTIIVIDNPQATLPPVAGDDYATTPQGQTVAIPVLNNDVDPDGGPLTGPTLISSTIPAGASATVLPNGQVVFTPAPNFTGNTQFNYYICDATSLCDTATVFVTVYGNTNRPPIAIDDYATTSPAYPVDINLVGNDYDPDNDDLVINLSTVTPPSNGSVIINPDGTARYFPNQGFFGTDQFVYSVCDVHGACDTATAYITIFTPSNDNDPPIAVDDLAQTPQNTPVIIPVLGNDRDPEFQPLTNPVVITGTGPSSGSLSVNSNGTITYTPTPTFLGTVTFDYYTCDELAQCDTATVTITVLPVTPPVNHPPVALTDNFTTLIHQPVVGNVLPNDYDPDLDNITINPVVVNTVDHGTLTLNPDGSFLYIPEALFVGIDSFQYQICDDGTPVLCDLGWAYINVTNDPQTPLNNPPFAADDAYITFVDVPVNGNVSLNDTDPEGDALVFTTTPVVPPLNGGTVSINPNGTFTYTPPSGYVGPDQFVYEVCESSTTFQFCTQATVYITVFNAPPDEICFSPKVFLQGSYSSSADSLRMYSRLRRCPSAGNVTVIPNAQPFNIQPFNYAGTEVLSSQRNDMVDWVLVEARSSRCQDSVVFQAPGILTRSGLIYNTLGDTVFCVPYQPGDEIWVAIHHRNHLGVLFPSGLTQVGVINNVDFRRTNSFQQGSGATATLGQRQIGSNGGTVYGMAAGNAVQYNNGTAFGHQFDINAIDLIPLSTQFSLFASYILGDYNMDCDCNAADTGIFAPNFNQFSAAEGCN